MALPDISRKALEIKLTEAGNKYDGHVTNGSLQKQMEVVDDFIKDVAKFMAGLTMESIWAELLKRPTPECSQCFEEEGSYACIRPAHRVRV